VLADQAGQLPAQPVHEHQHALVRRIRLELSIVCRFDHLLRLDRAAAVEQEHRQHVALSARELHEPSLEPALAMAVHRPGHADRVHHAAGATQLTGT
jgi:hypothetical protein